MENNLGDVKLETTYSPQANGTELRKTFCEVECEMLVPFENHPFKPYEGQRFTDMVESIRANGIFEPIIIRPHIKEDGKYEILSGHNRVRAAKEVGLKTAPAVVVEGISDRDALLIVTETNLIQRSFADLPHSEKATVIAAHYEAMKMKSGYRSDLLREIEELTKAPLGQRTNTRDKVGQQYGLGKTTIARYLRINMLIPALKARLDDDGIGMRVAEALSYLQTGEQEIVEKFLASDKKVTIRQADTLKKESESARADAKEMDEASIQKILEAETEVKRVRPLKLSGGLYSKYFSERQSEEEIERIMAEALEQYFANQTVK